MIAITKIELAKYQLRKIGLVLSDTKAMTRNVCKVYDVTASFDNGFLCEDKVNEIAEDLIQRYQKKYRRYKPAIFKDIISEQIQHLREG